MPEHEPPPSAAFEQVRLLLSEPVDFRQTDPETTEKKVQLLTAVAKYFNTIALTEYGGKAGGVRQEGLVEQVVGAVFQTYGGVDPHPDPFEKAAMLFRGITQGHPFLDANKRTGFLLSSYYLRQMGYPLPEHIETPAVISLATRVSSGELREVEQIATELKALWGAQPEQGEGNAP